MGAERQGSSCDTGQAPPTPMHSCHASTSTLPVYTDTTVRGQPHSAPPLSPSRDHPGIGVVGQGLLLGAESLSEISELDKLNPAP